MTKKTPKFTADPVLPVRPMNAHSAPFDYPLAAPSSLSADAQHVYLYGRGRILDRDLFDPARRRSFISKEEGEAFEPTERMLAAIMELEAANLATYSVSYGKTLRVTPVHEQYTFAQGRGSQLIEISIFDEHPQEAKLLAVLIGADLESRDAGVVPEITLRARHENATDFEHHASSSALLVIHNSSQPVFAGYGRMSFTGVLTKANLYPLGVDPLTADDGDTRPGGACADCKESHPFAPYLPPEVPSLSGAHFVTVKVWPFRPYLVAAPPVTDTTATLESENA